MSGTFFLAISLFLGWILSPEALVITSNLAGKGGLLSPVVLIGACLFSFFTLLLTHYQSEDRDPSPTEEITVNGFGFAATVSLALFIPTGILVTAGFTFNETFLYWFPNFGFSGILLFIILALHLLGDGAVQTAQRLFSSIAFLGIFIIILFGLLSPAANTLPLESSENLNYFNIFATSLLLFLGASSMPLTTISPIRLFLILAGGALFLSLWQLTAIQFVAADKLAVTTIPYVFVAREAMGQAGRIIIGITIIFGTLAAVNYLFFIAKSQTRQLLDGMVFSDSGKKLTGRIVALLLSIGIAIFMASGLAGEDKLETYIYASLLLWLLSSGVQVTFGWLRSGNAMFILLPAVLFCSALYLTVTHGELKPLVIFMTLALCPSFIFTSALVFLGKRSHKYPQ